MARKESRKEVDRVKEAARKRLAYWKAHPHRARQNEYAKTRQEAEILKAQRDLRRKELMMVAEARHLERLGLEESVVSRHWFDWARYVVEFGSCHRSQSNRRVEIERFS